MELVRQRAEGFLGDERHLVQRGRDHLGNAVGGNLDGHERYIATPAALAGNKFVRQSVSALAIAGKRPGWAGP